MKSITEDTVANINRPINATFYSVGKQPLTLHQDMSLTSFMKGGEERNSQSSYLKRIKVLPLTKGKRESNLTTIFYYGPVVDFTFDQKKQYEWKDGSSMMTYLAKKGRDFLHQRTPPVNLAESKWARVLPAHFNFDWKKLWDRTCTRKESTLIWLM